MESIIEMNNLQKYQKGKVEEVLINGKVRNRLSDLGLIKGTYIQCLYKNHGLSAYLIRGAVIALRNEDTSLIKIKLIN